MFFPLFFLFFSVSAFPPPLAVCPGGSPRSWSTGLQVYRQCGGSAADGVCPAREERSSTDLRFLDCYEVEKWWPTLPPTTDLYWLLSLGWLPVAKWCPTFSRQRKVLHWTLYLLTSMLEMMMRMRMMCNIRDYNSTVPLYNNIGTEV